MLGYTQASSNVLLMHLPDGYKF
eukprot:SAG11_NODE_29949_length_305_cov_1.252427_1_plen_22_part_01